MRKCEWCGRETMKKRFCCGGHRSSAWRKKYRKQMKKEHKCIDCGIKLKPVLVYHIRCPKHLKINRKR